MKTTLRSGFLFLLLTSLWSQPFSVQAIVFSSHFATGATVVDGDIKDASRLIGSPDGRMVLLKDRGDMIRVRLSEPMTSDLVLWHRLLSVSTAQLRFVFRDEDGRVVFEHVDQLLLGHQYRLPYTNDQSYLFVDILLESKESIELDAVGSASVITDASGEVVLSSVVYPFIDVFSRGVLVTLPDDGNENTQYDQTVYFIGGDGLRHAFPDETVFASWGFSFDEVRVIDRTTLHSYTLGANVSMRPGTFLVKAPSVPDVFVVSGIHELRHIPGEEAAQRWFGENWDKRVRDIPEIFFVHYRRLTPLDRNLESVYTQQPLWPY